MKPKYLGQLSGDQRPLLLFSNFPDFPNHAVQGEVDKSWPLKCRRWTATSWLFQSFCESSAGSAQIADVASRVFPYLFSLRRYFWTISFAFSGRIKFLWCGKIEKKYNFVLHFLGFSYVYIILGLLMKLKCSMCLKAFY